MADPTRMTQDPPDVRVVRFTWSSAALVVGAVIAFIVARGAFVAAHRIIGWAAACTAVAIFVTPLVDRAGRYVPRILAVLVSFVIVGAVSAGLVFGVVDNLDREVRALQRDMPDAVQQLEDRDDSLGRLATELDLSTRSESFLAELDQRVGSGAGALAQNATTVPVYFVCAILTVFLLVYGRTIVQGGLDQIGDQHRRVLTQRVLHEGIRQARRTMAVIVSEAVLVGVAMWVVAYGLDLPAPIVLGLIAGVVAMLPDVGIVLGSIPTLALTTALVSATTAAVLLVGVLVIQIGEVLVVRPRARAYGVEVGPSVVWIVALVGYTIYGPGMAFFGLAYALVALAVIDQVPVVRAEIDATASSSPAAI